MRSRNLFILCLTSLAFSLVFCSFTASGAETEQRKTLREIIREKMAEKKQRSSETASDRGVCGNYICESGENAFNCRVDCGISSPPYHPEKNRALQFYDPVARETMTRTYVVHVPPSYRPGTPMPVVINFHGALGTGESSEISVGGMNRKADEAGFIAVYPNGVSKTGTPGRKQYWNAGTLVDVGARNVDDAGFVNALLDRLAKDYSIDQKRIYATGLSNGAWMSYAVACKLSDRVAAIAPTAGGMVMDNCAPKSPVSIIHFHGTADPGWPYQGGGSCWTDTTRRPVMETINKWIELNRCSPSPKITYNRGDTTCKTYGPCARGAEITLCTIEGGGHTFPGGYSFPAERLVPWNKQCAIGQGGKGVGKIGRDISALDAMWDFFQKHPKQ